MDVVVSDIVCNFVDAMFSIYQIMMNDENSKEIYLDFK